MLLTDHSEELTASITLLMEAVSSSETLVSIYPEDSHLHTNILFFLQKEFFSQNPNLSVLLNITKTPNTYYSDMSRAIAPLNLSFYIKCYI
jgi:hypothetical protein